MNLLCHNKTLSIYTNIIYNFVRIYTFFCPGYILIFDFSYIYNILYIQELFAFWYLFTADLLPLCHLFYLYMCYNFKLYSLTSLCTCYSLLIICYFIFLCIQIYLYTQNFHFDTSTPIPFILIHGVCKQVTLPLYPFCFSFSHSCILILWFQIIVFKALFLSGWQWYIILKRKCHK